LKEQKGDELIVINQKTKISKKEVGHSK